MFSFHKVTLADKDWMQPLLFHDGWSGSEYTFGTNILWGVKYHIEACKSHGCCIVRYGLCGEYPWDELMHGDCFIYSFPIGPGDKKAALDELIADFCKSGRTLIMNSISEADRELLLNWYPDQFLIEEDRDYADYLYDRDKLATLTGRKMHNKRNHIARFKDAGEWSYEPLNDNNLEECRALCKRWVFSREDKWNDEMAIELKVLEAAFKMKDTLGLTGGVLRQKGRVVAFCMGEPVNDDVFVVHFEKALPEYQGAYPMINQQFVEHGCKGYKYINREDDAGDPGLRKAKLSYYPEILLRKFDAKLSPVVFMHRPAHEADIIGLWQEAFDDTPDFIRFYLDQRLTAENMLIYCIDRKPVSMASFLPAQIWQGEERLPVRYVYAVATAKGARGQGYARKVLDTAKDLWEEALLLTPAEASLVSYYGAQDFVSCTDGQQQELLLEDLTDDPAWLAAHSCAPCTASDYHRIRDTHFGRDGYVEWDDAALIFAIACAKRENGEALIYTTSVTEESGTEDAAHTSDSAENMTEDLLLYDCDGDTLRVLETTLSGTALDSALHQLLTRHQLRRAVLYTPAAMLWTPSDSPLIKDQKLDFKLDLS